MHDERLNNDHCIASQRGDCGLHEHAPRRVSPVRINAVEIKDDGAHAKQGHIALLHVHEVGDDEVPVKFDVDVGEMIINGRNQRNEYEEEPDVIVVIWPGAEHGV